MKWCLSTVLFTTVVLMVAQPTRAESLSATDCAEGGDFIRNAALSRNNGLAAEQFLERLEGDLLMLRGIPEASRWFAYSTIEENLLRQGSLSVFRNPKDPQAHHDEFVRLCETVRTSARYLESKSPAGLAPFSRRSDRTQ